MNLQRYFEAAETDLRRYIDYHVNINTPFLHLWDVSELRIKLHRALQPSTARAKEGLTWRANTDTFIKASTLSSGVLSANEKTPVARGAIVTAQFGMQQGDHILVLGAVVDGTIIQKPVSYLYRSAWTQV